MKTLDQLKNENEQKLCIIKVRENTYCYARVKYADDYEFVAIFDGIDEEVIIILYFFTPCFSDYNYAISSLLSVNKHHLIYRNSSY